MSFPIKRPAFEQVFEAWLSRTAAGDDYSEPEVAVVGNSRQLPGDSDGCELSPLSTEGSSTPQQSTGLGLVCRHARLVQGKRFHAYKAVLKKYSRRGWVHSKKSSFSPGSQTDDSGVVSPGVDPSMETGKDALVEGSYGCLSGDDSPPNIQDDFANRNVWPTIMHYSLRLGGECLEQPPELRLGGECLEQPPKLRLGGECLEQPPELRLGGECLEQPPKLRLGGECLEQPPKLRLGGECLEQPPTLRPSLHLVTASLTDRGDPKRTTSPNSIRSSMMTSSVRGEYNFLDGVHMPRNGKLHLSPGSESNRVKRVKGDLSRAGVKSNGAVPRNGGASLCMETALAADGDHTGYVSRNGCEVSASDSGAGSQSESCCEESPHHVSSGHIKTPQFPCDNHRFAVVPSDTSSPPLVLKLKKCEQESNVKDSPTRYFAVEVVDKIKKADVVVIADKSVVLSHSSIAESPACAGDGVARTKRVKAGRSNGMCSCCMGTDTRPSKKHHSRSANKCKHASASSKTAEDSHPKFFIRQCVHLSLLQTKVHTLFRHLFPRLQAVLSQVSPEGNHFARVVDDVIVVLQKAELDDDVEDTTDISGGLENMTLKGDNCAEHVEPVFEPSIVLCRSPNLCLEEFREKIFVLVQLLLPTLTLSVDNNRYRSHRDLERFLDKIIAQNCADA